MTQKALNHIFVNVYIYIYAHIHTFNTLFYECYCYIIIYRGTISSAQFYNIVKGLFGPMAVLHKSTTMKGKFSFFKISCLSNMAYITEWFC